MGYTAKVKDGGTMQDQTLEKEPTVASEAQPTQMGTPPNQKWWQKYGTYAAWAAVGLTIVGISMQIVVFCTVTWPGEKRDRAADKRDQVAATMAVENATRGAALEAADATRKAAFFQPNIKVYCYVGGSPDLLAPADQERLRGLLPPRVIPTTYQRQLSSQGTPSPNYQYLFLLFVNRGQGPADGLTINKLQWKSQRDHFGVDEIPKLVLGTKQA